MEENLFLRVFVFITMHLLLGRIVDITGHDYNNLSARNVCGEEFSQLAESAIVGGIMYFRNLPRNGSFAVGAKDFGKFCQSFSQSLGRFIDNYGTRFSRQFDNARSTSFLRREKTRVWFPPLFRFHGRPLRA